MTKEEIIKILKKINIEELDFKPRAYNCLKSNNINTLYDLTRLKIEDIKKIRNIGEKSLNEIVYKVHYLGLQFMSEEQVQLKTDNLIKFVSTIKKYEDITENKKQEANTKLLDKKDDIKITKTQVYKIYLDLERTYSPLDTEDQYQILKNVAEMICDLSIPTLFGKDENQTYIYRKSLGLFDNNKKPNYTTIIKETKRNRYYIVKTIKQVEIAQRKYIINLLMPYYLENYRFNKINIFDIYPKSPYTSYIFSLAYINTLEDVLGNTKEELWHKIYIETSSWDAVRKSLYDNLCQTLYSLNLKLIDELEDTDPLKQYLILEHQKQQIFRHNNNLSKKIEKYTSLEKELQNLLEGNCNNLDSTISKIKIYYKDFNIENKNKEEAIQIIKEKLLITTSINAEFKSLYNARCLLSSECSELKELIADKIRDKNKKTKVKTLKK